MMVAVESKFTEHLSVPRRGRCEFAPAYFLPSRQLWASAGLPKCQEMAEALNAQDLTYDVLDTCQLPKHALGLVTAQG